jgi:hypothetical protein
LVHDPVVLDEVAPPTLAPKSSPAAPASADELVTVVLEQAERARAAAMVSSFVMACILV